MGSSNSSGSHMVITQATLATEKSYSNNDRRAIFGSMRIGQAVSVVNIGNLLLINLGILIYALLGLEMSVKCLITCLLCVAGLAIHMFGYIACNKVGILIRRENADEYNSCTAGL